MFKLKLWMTPLLCLFVGSALVFIGTTYLHDHLIPPFEREISSVKMGTRGLFRDDVSYAITAATKLSDLADVRVAVGLSAESGTTGEILAPAEGRFGTPGIVAVATADGKVVKRAGAESGFPDDVAGLPMFAEALTGGIRDGHLRIGETTYVVVGAPIVKDRKAVGAVIAGFKLDDAYVDAIGKALGVDVIGLDQGKRMGAALPGFTADDLKLSVSMDTFGALALTLPPELPLPLFVPDARRYIASGVGLYGTLNGPMLIPILDRNSAFDVIALAQVFVGGASMMLALLLALLVLSVLSSISAPLDALMEHLGQYAQGAPVGILPETALSGPFKRLGKQINMIIQAPPMTAGPRPGSPPVTPIGRPTSGAFALGDLQEAANAYGNPSAQDDELQFEGIPGLGGAPSTSALDAAFGGPPTPPPMAAPSLPGFGGGPGAKPPALPDDDELPPASLPGQPSGFSAAAPALPGGAPSSGLAGLFDDAGPDPLAAFRVGGGAPPAPPVPRAAPPPPPAAAPAAHGYNPDATVMFQVPQELIQESAQVSQSGRAIPPVEDRTVVAQVPAELLSRSAPKQASVASEEEAHYRQVYGEFIETRQQCGEDVDQLTYDKFLQKLMKNREQIIEKYNSRSVRFQVYVKQGKAALRAVPVRD